ncbi:MAG: CDP-paratose 2-epimerase [Gemmatimonadales bacterium]|nr:MAG: CDP-paratose 2-epimerase [Gemmatimonadales bacterium]
MRVLRAETFLPLPRRKVFRFFSDAGNLEQITPPGLHFDILTPQPVQMGQGTLLDYRLRLLGIPFGWRTEITEWNPPHSFADRQLRGPYRLWLHRHDFRKVKGGTLMVDEVLWKLPLRPVGEVAAPWVRWQLGSIFRYRRDAVAGILGGG